jgi:uncharacterized protein
MTDAVENLSENPLMLGRKGVSFPPFRARLPWLGGDLQTLHNTFMRPLPDFSSYSSERLFLKMSDGSGDALWALVNQPTLDTGKPTVILVHGLTGCETSRNIMVSAAYHLSQGYPVVRLNLRGAGPSLGMCEGHYHAGRSADLRDAIAELPARLKSAGVFVVGVSLGGNMLLKYLSENEGTDDVVGAAAVCAPIDLRAAQLRIMAPRNVVYHRHLLRSMKQDAMRWEGKHVGNVHNTLPKINSVYDFDDLIVARQNGFEGAEDYYRRSSAKPLLGRICKPTLLLHPRTDPWVPAQMYLDIAWSEKWPITLVMPPDGGHVGFHDAVSQTPWHDRCISKFLVEKFLRRPLGA